MTDALTSRVTIFGGLAVATVAGYSLLLTWAIANLRYDLWGALLVIPVLILLSVPVLLREGSVDPDPRMGALLVIGLLLKLFAALPRYWMSFGLYEGAADAARYATDGALVAEQIRAGDLTPQIGIPVMGTGFVVIVTGFVFSVIGPTTLGGYVVFSWLGFWGLFFLNRAFREGVPGGDRWRFAVLLFLLPSMLFWPSSIGKDSVMLLGIGLIAYGAALVLTFRASGWLFLVAGSAITMMVRPHITLMAITGLSLAFVLRRRAKGGPLRTLVMAGALIVGASFILQQAAGFLGLESIDAQSVTSTIEGTSDRTTGGGSTFESQPASSPLDLPWAVVTVLFRPFPFEAHNVQSLISSLEGAVLMGVMLASLGRLKTLPRHLRSTPYLVFVIVYTLLFCYAFSSFANFGILARERVMVFPMVIALLALAPVPAGLRRGAPPRRGRSVTAFAERRSPL